MGRSAAKADSPRAEGRPGPAGVPAAGAGAAATGAIDLDQDPAARPAVVDALGAHGVDVAHRVAAEESTPIAPASEREGTLERLQKLMELKSAELITDAEFERHRARILEDM
jgi:hypothetical protein